MKPVRLRLSPRFSDWLWCQASALDFGRAGEVINARRNWIVVSNIRDARATAVFLEAVGDPSYPVGNRGAGFRRFAARRLAQRLRSTLSPRKSNV